MVTRVAFVAQERLPPVTPAGLYDVTLKARGAGGELMCVNIKFSIGPGASGARAGKVIRGAAPEEYTWVAFLRDEWRVAQAALAPRQVDVSGSGEREAPRESRSQWGKRSRKAGLGEQW